MFIKSLIPEFFLLIVRFSMCKIQHFFRAKRSFENLRGITGRNFLNISFIFTVQLRIEQHLLSL